MYAELIINKFLSMYYIHGYKFYRVASVTDTSQILLLKGGDMEI